MTSSDAPKPNASRKFFWWAVFLVLLFGGYTAGWFFVANRLDREVERTISRLAANDVTLDCANRAVRGYPFRLGLFCDGVQYDDPERNIHLKTGALRTAAQIYQPLRTVAELDGPFTLNGPDFPPIELSWTALRASARLARPLPERVSVVADGLNATMATDAAHAAQVFSATHMEGHMRPNGADLDWAGNFTGLTIHPAIVDGRIVPPLAGESDIKIVNGATLLAERPKSLRGQSFEVRNLVLSAGEGSVVATGPITFDDQGLLDANLQVTLKNPKAISAVLQTAVPERSREINTGFAGLALMGPEFSLPLRVVKGKAQLGFIPLGDVPAIGE